MDQEESEFPTLRRKIQETINFMSFACDPNTSTKGSVGTMESSLKIVDGIFTSIRSWIWSFIRHAYRGGGRWKERYTRLNSKSYISGVWAVWISWECRHSRDNACRSVFAGIFGRSECFVNLSYDISRENLGKFLNFWIASCCSMSEITL